MFSAVADLCMPNERGGTRCRALFVTLVGAGENTNPAFTAVHEGTERELCELWKWLNGQSWTWQLLWQWHRVNVDTKLSPLQAGEPLSHS